MEDNSAKVPVESVATQEQASTVDVDRARKQFFIVLAVAGALIVGLVVSIIIVAVNKKGGSAPAPDNEITIVEELEDNPEGYILTDAELNDAYTDIASEIAEATLAASENGEGFGGILQLYLNKINATEDIRLKAMLETDYYFMRFSMTPTEEFKNEILNTLMRIDGILKTPMSAYNVVDIATFYNEQEMVNYYTNLAIERGSNGNSGGSSEDEEELETAP